MSSPAEEATTPLIVELTVTQMTALEEFGQLAISELGVTMSAEQVAACCIVFGSRNPYALIGVAKEALHSALHDAGQCDCGTPP